jgi:hypothetical protein
MILLYHEAGKIFFTKKTSSEDEILMNDWCGLRVYTQYFAPLLHYLNSTFQKGANKGQALFFFY